MTDQVEVEQLGADRRSNHPVVLTVNGVRRRMMVSPTQMLLGLLRDEFGLTGAKAGCEVGVCGACTVLVDGKPTSSCHTFTAQVDGSEVMAVEGLAAMPELRRLQEAFVDHGGFQCGFCTSGQLMAVASLMLSGEIEILSDHEVKEYMLGNLCRCGTYYGIFRAIDEVRQGGQR